MSTDRIDLEKGPITSTARPTSSILGISDPHKPSDLQHFTSLEQFQCLVGIQTPNSLTLIGINSNESKTWGFLPRRSDNIGLYQRAVDEEKRGRIAYLVTSTISNTLYMLQIVLAATFTALSAYKDSSPVTLTVLGAFTTVVAGCLAWQKGQGVPQRYRKARDEYRALVAEIEMAERSFLVADNSSDSTLDPRKEKERLQRLFDKAQADQQANYPDLYVSTAVKESKEENQEK